MRALGTFPDTPTNFRLTKKSSTEFFVIGVLYDVVVNELGLQTY